MATRLAVSLGISTRISFLIPWRPTKGLLISQRFSDRLAAPFLIVPLAARYQALFISVRDILEQRATVSACESSDGSERAPSSRPTTSTSAPSAAHGTSHFGLTRTTARPHASRLRPTSAGRRQGTRPGRGQHPARHRRRRCPGSPHRSSTSTVSPEQRLAEKVSRRKARPGRALLLADRVGEAGRGRPPRVAARSHPAGRQ
jgi:hypothetical protein